MRKYPKKIKIIRKALELQKFSKKMLGQGKSIGLVPTMGALHKGHIHLVETSAKNNDVTIVSIFINPTQFGANEDFAKYPRRLQADAKLCAEAGANIVFAPEPKEMYPQPLQTYVRNAELENVYCGKWRPGHFAGVLSVVAKLLNIALPSRAYFGEKDFQQLHVIRKMVFDLNFPVKVIGVKTIREKNGLAMSSRNEYMSLKEREAASSIYAGLMEAKKMYERGIDSVVKLKGIVEKKIKQAGGKIQYVEIANKNDLQPIKTKVSKNAVILLACHFGKTRLIDHLEFF
ncbi:MAG: pantoate--beta-alanine ligase [Fibromonadaceae bacterium]|jgi:pantoate--beta-alanine ligase|nr:pantoate--beta-alanine ligase [Fibromonadaceae bacterium]